MTYILFFTIMANGMQYLIAEPMQSLSQCRRLLTVIESSEMVIEARCGGVIFDKVSE